MASIWLQKKNSKTKGLMEFSDKILIRKRAVTESVNGFLKNICQIEHSRHRSCCNFIVNLVSGIAAYSFLPDMAYGTGSIMKKKNPLEYPFYKASKGF